MNIEGWIIGYQSPKRRDLKPTVSVLMPSNSPNFVKEQRVKSRNESPRAKRIPLALMKREKTTHQPNQ